MESSELLKWIVGVIAALVTGGLVVNFVVHKKSTKVGDIRNTTQSNNQAGGDIIGGDSIKKLGK